ncbi:hypothetical protein BC938DRAFT_477081 [Jimgerdemannia flammicorona]|uniref:Peptidase C14 caspase domain-containing protein n=1 Tax=Jimgerdemannia flammicorona TaxID=994334 RepID=A0A433QPU1_9FUNG|nr:hypothetical protein BC938DRAFT_477081 [Jimgerdemannia flammicorona]
MGNNYSKTRPNTNTSPKQTLATTKTLPTMETVPNMKTLSSSKTFPNGHALLIGTGTNIYGQISASFESTINDAKWLNEVLTEPSLCGYPENQVKLLQGEEATRTVIIEELDVIKNRISKSSESSTVVVFFSGHGHRRASDGKVFLIPYGYKQGEPLEARAIDGDFLFEKLNSLMADRILLLLNACYAGGVMAKLDGQDVDGQETLGPDPKAIPFTERQLKRLRSGQGVVIISAAQPSQRAETAHLAKDRKTRYSPFMIGLARGFSGIAKTEHDDGLVYTSDLFAACTTYVHEKTKNCQMPHCDFDGANFAVGCYQLGTASKFKLLSDDVEIDFEEDTEDAKYEDSMKLRPSLGIQNYNYGTTIVTRGHNIPGSTFVNGNGEQLTTR